MATKNNARAREATQRKKSDADAWLKGQGSSEATGVRLPEGMSWWKPKVGVNRIDVIPFVAGKGNPFADEGYEHWERQYYRHYVPGFDGQSRPYACLGNWKEPCPICQYLQRLDKERDKDVIQSMKGKLQVLMNVIDLDDREPDKIQVWEAVYYNRQKGFGEQLITALRAQPKYKNFSDLQKGYSLVLTAVEEQGGRSKYVCVTRIDFAERSKQYPDDFIEKAACLDDCLVRHTYADLKQLVDGGHHQEQDNGQHVPASDHRSVSGGRSVAPQAADPANKPRGDDEERSETEIEVGNTISHPKHDGKLTVLKVNPTKTMIEVEDEGGAKHKLKASECAPYEEEEQEDDSW